MLAGVQMQHVVRGERGAKTVRFARHTEEMIVQWTDVIQVYDASISSTNSMWPWGRGFWGAHAAPGVGCPCRAAHGRVGRFGRAESWPLGPKPNENAFRCAGGEHPIACPVLTRVESCQRRRGCIARRACTVPALCTKIVQDHTQAT